MKSLWIGLAALLLLLPFSPHSDAQAQPWCYYRELRVEPDGTVTESWQPYLCADAPEPVTPVVGDTPVVVDTPTPEPTATATPGLPTGTPTPLPPTPTWQPTATAQVTATPNPVAQTHIVPDQYASISAAITAAQPGDTVLVRAGTYPEQATIGIGKDGVTLQGEPGAWIDGECLRPNGVHVYGPSDVTVTGLGVKRTNGAGILVERRTTSTQVYLPSRTTVTGNTVQDFNCDGQTQAQIQAGISFVYGGPGQTATHNTITRRVEVAGEQRGHGNGIHFQADTSRASGGGHLVADNTITGGYDGIGGSTESSPNGAYDGHTTIARNYITGCGDDGIQVEGGTHHVQVLDNVILECGIGVAFANARTGPLTIERNVIRSSSPGLLDVLACFKLGNASEAMIYVTHNDCTVDYAGDPALPATRRGDGFKQTNSGQSYYVSRNNVLRVSRYVVEINGAPRVYTSFDGDCMQTSDPERFWDLGGVRYPDLASLQAAGHESNGREGPCP